MYSSLQNKKFIMKKILIFLFSLLILTSCDEKEIENQIGGIGYIYHARQCKYAWALNVGLDPVPYYDTFVYEKNFLPKGDSVSIDKYELYFTTLNASLDSIKESDLYDFQRISDYNDYNRRLKSGASDSIVCPPFIAIAYLKNTYEEAHDIVIEKKLDDYFRRMSKTRMNFVDLDYRTTPIKNLNITASQDFNGIKAGKSLNSLFVVSGYESRHYFIITANKDLITDADKIRDISIDQYLYYHPMAPASLYMKFRDNVNVSAPVETTFRIEITTDEGNVIKCETPLVTLMPNEE